MGQVLSSILRLLLPWNWKPGRSQRLSDEDFYVHFDDDQSQSQLILPVHAQEQEQGLAESSCADIDIIIDHFDPSPDLPISDGLLSAPSSDHNIDLIIDHFDPSPDLPTSDGLLSAPSSDTNIDIIIDHFDPSPDLPTSDGLLSAPSSDHNIDIIIDHFDPSPDLPTSDGLLSAPSSDHNNQITTTTALHINTNNITKTLQEVATSDDNVTTLEPVQIAKRIGPYTSSHKILLVGEGDFSFSACLAVAFGSASNMVATSRNSLGFLLKNYREFPTNKIKLVGRGCIVLHGIDATQMATHPQLWNMKFDRIVFNFPLSGFRHEKEPTHSEMSRHQKLVSGFLRSAKQMINENGQIHIRHKCNGFFLRWNISKLASDQGLLLIQEAKFQLSMFPGYHTKYGFGGDRDFECHPSKTYMFGLTSAS